MHRNIRLMQWFNFLSDFRLYAPITIIYFEQVAGSFASALLIFSIFSISASVLEIPTGIYSDRIGRRKTMILGAMASVVSITLYAIGTSFWILALGAIFAGLQGALYSGNNDALLYDTLGETKEQKKFGEYMSKTSSMIPLALGISALIGGFIAGFSFRYVLWLSVIPQLIALLISIFMSEPKVHFEKISGNIFVNLNEAFKQFKNNYKLRHLSLSSILHYGLSEVGHQFMPAFVSTVWPVWSLGISRAMSNLFSFVGSRSAGSFLKRFPPFKILIINALLSIALTLIAVTIPGIWSPILIGLTSIPFGIAGVALSTLLHGEFNDKQRATMGSINSLFGNLFFALFAYLFGLIADNLGTAKPIIITQVLTLSVVYLYWKMFRLHKK